MKKKEINEQKVVLKVSKNSVIANVVLSIGKLLAGIIGKSSAMISDAIHSFSDVFSTFIIIVGVKLGSKTSDKDHPYGHEKFECVTTIILSFLLLFTAIALGFNSVRHIVHKDISTIPSITALIAAVVSIVVKEGMYWYTIYYAKEINSLALKADAWHHRSDALSSIGSFVGILLSMVGVKYGDAVACIIISLFIVKVAIDIFIEAINKVVDKSCDDETVEKITKTILANSEVKRIDDLKTRLAGNKVYVDVEISVDNTLSLEEAHDIAEDIHNRVETKYKNVKHCMVHVNPIKNEE